MCRIKRTLRNTLKEYPEHLVLPSNNSRHSTERNKLPATTEGTTVAGSLYLQSHKLKPMQDGHSTVSKSALLNLSRTLQLDSCRILYFLCFIDLNSRPIRTITSTDVISKLENARTSQ